MGFVNCFYILLENSYYAKTQCQRITKMFGVENNINFVIKCLLTKRGEYFSICFMLGTMYLYATLINVSEIGYVLTLKPEDFPTYELYLENVKINSLLIYYYNTFWNILITMTTIGYGDVVVKSTLSRLIIFFCALSGTVILPLLVVTITKLFELPKNEKVTLKIIQMSEAKKEVQLKASKVILVLAKINYNLNRGISVENERQILMVQIKHFTNSKKKYESLYQISDLDDIENKIERINFKFDTFMKYFFDYNFVIKN